MLAQSFQNLQTFLPTIILRHRRENLKKCSLRGLESRSDLQFFSYPKAQLPDLSNYVLLDFEGPVLSENDAPLGLFIIDSTWRYSEVMRRFVDAHCKLPTRSLPSHFRTAYPRRQEDCADPERGLASVEALWLSYVLSGRNPDGLLQNYHWAEEFLKKNSYK